MKRSFALFLTLSFGSVFLYSQNIATSFDWSLFDGLHVIQTNKTYTLVNQIEQLAKTSAIQYDICTRSDGYHKIVESRNVLIQLVNGVAATEGDQELLRYQIIPLNLLAYYDGTYFKWSGYDNVRSYLSQNFSSIGLKYDDINSILEEDAVTQWLLWKLLVEKWNNNYIYNGKQETGSSNYVIRFGSKLPNEICLSENAEYTIEGDISKIKYHGEASDNEIKRCFPAQSRQCIIAYIIDIDLVTDSKTLIPYEYKFTKTIGIKSSDGTITYHIEESYYSFSRMAF